MMQHLESTTSFSWFTRKGIFFQPVSLVGWIILLVAVAGSIYLFIAIDSRSHSASDTLMNWAFNSMIIAMVYSLIGVLTQKKK